MLKQVIIFGFLIIVQQNIFAQQTGYQSGSASANLIVPLSIEAGKGNLDFGDIIVGSSSFKEKIKPRSGKEFIVKGQANRNISVVFNNVLLNNHLWVSNNNGQSGTLPFTPKVILQNSKKVKSGDNIILEPNGLIGEIKFNVGGSIDIQANQPLGDYEGLFVISVSY
jgi:Domain of unknown function (DUF4402)